MLGLGDGEAADAAGDDDAAAVRLGLVQGEVRIGHGLHGADHGELGENGPSALISGLGRWFSGTKPLTSAASFTFMSLGSNWVMGRDAANAVPTACQLSTAVRPTGVMRSQAG